MTGTTFTGNANTPYFGTVRGPIGYAFLKSRYLLDGRWPVTKHVVRSLQVERRISLRHSPRVRASGTAAIDDKGPTHFVNIL